MAEEKRPFTESEMDAMLMAMKTQIRFITETVVEVTNSLSATDLPREAIAGVAVNTYLHMAEPVFHVTDCQAHQHEEQRQPGGFFDGLFGSAGKIGLQNPDGSITLITPPEQEPKDDSDKGDDES